MKTILLLLASTFCFAQSNTKTMFDQFKTELDGYSTQSSIALKPAHCNEYVLKYTVNGEKISSPAATQLRNLCDDLKAYDKNPSLTDWTFDIKPIGDQYYVIKAERTKPVAITLLYYYGRKAAE